MLPEEQQVPDVPVALAASREPVSQSQVEAPTPASGVSGASVSGALVSPALTSQAPESRPRVERAQLLQPRAQ